MSQLVMEIEKDNLKKKIPYFKVGDTVRVQTRIVEGDKERLQAYVGTVIGRKGSGLSETFSVSRVAFGYANEKVFPIHGPGIVKIEVTKRGDVRQAKLNYIRGKLGKAAKVKAKIGGKIELYQDLVEATPEEEAAAAKMESATTQTQVLESPVEEKKKDQSAKEEKKDDSKENGDSK